MQWYRDISIYPDIPGYKLAFERSVFAIDMESIALFEGGFEFGWVVLNALFHFVSDNFDSFLKFIGLLVCAGYIYAISRYSNHPLFSVLFILLYPSAFGMSFYILKQSLAFSIILFALHFINEGKPYKYLCLVFLAFSIHYSAVIFLPLYWLKKYVEKQISLLIIFPVSLLFIVGTRLLSYISTNDVLSDKYASYLSSGGNLLPLLLVSFVTIIMIMKRRIIHEDFLLSQDEYLLEQDEYLLEQDEYKLNYSYIIVAYCILGTIICVGIYGTRMDRMALYFTNFLAFSVPFASSTLEPITAKIFRWAYLIFTFVWVLVSDSYCDIKHFSIV